MRTRQYNSMTNHEIETYLDRNDVIFIPIGNAEMHNPLPVDVEYVQAEAWARLFAERYDGLFFPNLIYMNAGGTESGRGTIQMSIIDSMRYMYAIARSLLKQGFRRQVYIPSHRPSSLLMHPMIHQIFEDTKVPLLMLEPFHLFQARKLVEGRPFHFGEKFHVISTEDQMGDHVMDLGAYKICRRLDDVPTGAEANIPGTIREEGWIGNYWFPKHDIINECSSVHCPAPFFYTYEYEHAAGPLPNTREEIEREAQIGEDYMRDLVDRCGFDEHLAILRELDEYIQNTCLPRNRDHLFDDRWSM